MRDERNDQGEILIIEMEIEEMEDVVAPGLLLGD
jgi:hypothetical protein